MASRKPQTTDAIQLLKDDHAAVKELFGEFKKFQEAKTEGVDEIKQAIMDDVCAMLKVHTQIEEEIFYPAAREALEDEEDLMNEAEVEHDGAKELMAKIEAGSAKDPMTCAQFLVLSEQIDHHVKEEHEDMFPKVQKTELDTQALGERMAKRKQELEGAAGAKAVHPSEPPRMSAMDRIANYMGR